MTKGSSLMFFDLFKKKKMKKKKITFLNVDNLTITCQDNHYEIYPDARIIRYRNVGNKGSIYRELPDGYCDEKETVVPEDDMDLISDTFDRMFKNGIPGKDVSHMFICPGFFASKYMSITLKEKTEDNYTDAHVSEDGYVIGFEPETEEFFELVKLFKKHCSFPRYVPSAIPITFSPELIRKVDVDIESGNRNTFVGYRFAVTGMSAYYFYQNDENICTVSSIVIPSRPVNICGNGVAWISEIEDCTIFPGMTRTVVDKSNDNPILKIVYKEEGMYEINESIKVYCSFEAYSFYCDDILIATIKRIKDPAGYPKPATDQYDDYEPYFDVVSLDGIDTELMMAVMAFPILRFAFR